MPNIENLDEAGKLEPGVVLKVTGAASENDAILAVENYLRANRKEQLEVAVPERDEDGVFAIRLE
ncbi:hypothetical protein [Dyadobacter sp. 676]|jgi:hypothetical protein|uniref:Uncharacterized protein n=1 Tax=Dyadobacter sp. 676 TaxID=3088362 RepID=A0AAU8FF68_9BACT